MTDRVRAESAVSHNNRMKLPSALTPSPRTTGGAGCADTFAHQALAAYAER